MNDTPPRHRPATADEIRTRRGIATAPTDRAVTPLVTPQEVYNEWASERLHLFSTPPGPEGVFWQRWMDHAAKDVEWITGGIDLPAAPTHWCKG